MNVSCPDCRTIYRVDPGKIPSRGVVARCARCSGAFLVAGVHGEPRDEVAPAPTAPEVDASDRGIPGAEDLTPPEARAEEPTNAQGWRNAEGDDLPPVSGPELVGEAAELPRADEVSRMYGEHERAPGDAGDHAEPADDEGRLPLINEWKRRSDETEPGVVAPPDLETNVSWEGSWRRSEPAAHEVEEESASGGESEAGVPERDELRVGDDAEPPPGASEAAEERAAGEPFAGSSANESGAEDRIELVGVGFEDEEVDRYETEEAVVEEVSVELGYVAVGDNFGTGRPASGELDPEEATADYDQTEEREPEAVTSPESREEPSRGAARAEPADLRATEEAAVLAGFSAAPAPATGEAELPPAPFGSSDPHARARRLARALVSDIVVYHPDRRERSLRDGTLRQEFKEEIRKSWDEYVANVGDHLARGTTYFRDALNDLLAGGSRLF